MAAEVSSGASFRAGEPRALFKLRSDLIGVDFSPDGDPMWVNPDGFMWLKALKDESKLKCYVALTPTWNETAWFADYVLPTGHGPERHDLMSQETHSGQWIAFRQPVRRVAMERAGIKVDFTYQANPGEVWEENEFWIQISARFDPDGSLGIRQYFESPYRAGEIITVDEYYQWIFENSVPGLREVAAQEGLAPLAYMRKYGVFEVKKENYMPYDKPLPSLPQCHICARVVPQSAAQKISNIVILLALLGLPDSVSTMVRRTKSG